MTSATLCLWLRPSRSKLPQPIRRRLTNKLTDAMTGSDKAAAQRVFKAMMSMKKIDIAAINHTRENGTTR
jgi:hypothetical protein